MCLKIPHPSLFNNSTLSNCNISNQQSYNDLGKVYIKDTHVDKVNTSICFLSFQDHFQQQFHFFLNHGTNVI